MVVVRPASPADLEGLVELARFGGFGLTTLPRDLDLLRERVRRSVASFESRPEAPGEEDYFFVMEDAREGGERVVGTAGILARVGVAEPFYTFRIETHVFRSKVLQVERRIPCFHLSVERYGSTEIGSLFVAPDYRDRGQGRLMSLSRFLYMAEEPARFQAEVIAEMRGLIEPDGRCPFWEAVGRHFYDLDFPTADYLTLKDKRFIAELLPEHPIYIPLLAPEGQAAIGQVHRDTAPALKLLQGEGFRVTDRIDAFDGGPLVACPLRNIRTVRESRRASVEALSCDELDGALSLVAKTAPEFRVCLGRVAPGPGGGVVLEEEVAKVLRVREGDLVRYSPLRSRPEEADGH